MKDIIRTKKHILFFLLISLLLLPFLNYHFNFIHLPPLKGAITIANDTTFTFDGWFSGKYQDKKGKFINDSFGFRNFFVRLNNQVKFELFNKAQAKQVIVGKSHCLYEESYIKAYCGSDFVGEDGIARQMKKLKFLQDTLGHLNKSLILVFAPGKGFYYPEFIPSRYLQQRGPTNIEYRLKYAKELRLNFIDFHSYFIANKISSKYTLYPKNGIHWSSYGAAYAADSLIKYIESLRKIDMPNLFWNTVNIEKSKNEDCDIAEGMNLLCKIEPEILAYPDIHFESDSGKTKPSMIIISDSFYSVLYNLGISGVFSTSKFWFYNQWIYPESFDKPFFTTAVDLKKEIDQHDLIIIMSTTPGMTNLGWGFIESAYNLFKGIEEFPSNSPEFIKKINEIRTSIINDKNWLEKIKIKAQRKNVSVDSMITLDAIWILQNKQ